MVVDKISTRTILSLYHVYMSSILRSPTVTPKQVVSPSPSLSFVDLY